MARRKWPGFITLQPNPDQPFLLGYFHGSITRVYVSNEDVTRNYPDWSADQIAAYQNGRDDGVGAWASDRPTRLVLS